jgi:hypothetical protein
MNLKEAHTSQEGAVRILLEQVAAEETKTIGTPQSEAQRLVEERYRTDPEWRAAIHDLARDVREQLERRRQLRAEEILQRTAKECAASPDREEGLLEDLAADPMVRAKVNLNATVDLLMPLKEITENADPDFLNKIAEGLGGARGVLSRLLDFGDWPPGSRAC